MASKTRLGCGSSAKAGLGRNEDHGSISCSTAALAAVSLIAAHCSPVDYVLGVSAGTDASVAADQDGSVPEASTEAGSVLGPFGQPELVPGITDATYSGSNPSLTVDLLELYFTAERPGGMGLGDTWVAQRATAADSWGPPVPVTDLNSENSETGPAVSPDGLSLWFSSDRPGGPGKTDIWTSTRTTRTAAWSAPVLVPELSSLEVDLVRPAMGSPLIMLVASTKANPPEYDLYVATRKSVDLAWETPVPITEINSPESDVDPFLSADGLGLYFNSSRVPEGHEDLYVAVRATTTGAFSAPAPIAELNTPSNERDPWLSADLRTIFFCSNRSGTYEIYQAHR